MFVIYIKKMYSFYELMKKYKTHDSNLSPKLSPKLKPVIKSDTDKKEKEIMRRNESNDNFMKFQWPWIN